MDHHTSPSGYQYPSPPSYHYPQTGQPEIAPSPSQAQHTASLGEKGAFSPPIHHPSLAHNTFRGDSSSTSIQNPNLYFPPPPGSHSAPPGPALPIPSAAASAPIASSSHEGYGLAGQPWQQQSPWEAATNQQHHYGTPGPYGQAGHYAPPQSSLPAANPSQPHQQQQRPPNQQRLSLSSLSGKKTASWLKKNVSPHLTEVARSSLVQGSIKELSSAYTAAKGMRDTYSAKYTSPPSSNYNLPTARPSDASQPAQTWNHTQLQSLSPTVHQPQEAAALSQPVQQHQAPFAYRPALHQPQEGSLHSPLLQQTPTAAAYDPVLTVLSTPPITRKPVAAQQQQAPALQTASQHDPPTQMILPAEAADKSQGYILSIDHERKKAIRVIPGPNGSDRYVLEDLSTPNTAVSTADVAPTLPSNAEPSGTESVVTQHQPAELYSPPPQTYDSHTLSPSQGHHDLVPPPLFGATDATASTRNPYQPPPVPVKPDFMSKVISAVSQVKLSDTLGHLKPQKEREEEADIACEPLALATPISAAGTSSSALRMCPQTRVVKYSTTWYYLKGHLDFGICSWCFNKYVRSSSITHEFESLVKSGESCRFHVPRVTKSLWPEAERAQAVGRLRDYISRRVSIPACKKSGGAIGTDGVKWIGLTKGEIGMAVCESCHEDVVLGTPFADRFSPLQQVQGATERWTCTVSYQYVNRTLQILSRRSDQETAWEEFIEVAKKRMGLPDCEGKTITATGCNWYRPKQNVANLDFCEACYLDTLAMTPFANHFAGTEESFEQKLCMRTCDLALINLGECLHVCRTKGLDIGVFLKAAAKISSSPRCFKGTSINDGRFYNFANGGAGNYGICESCHAGILVPHGMASFYAPEPQLVPGSAYCAFNPSLDRFQGLIDNWLQAAETGAWGPYEQWVRKYAALAICPNFNLAANRKWYGWQDLTICPECYEAVAEGTSLAGSMELKDEPIQEERLCSLYSDRMRAKYKEACDAGDAAELLALNRQRWVTYQQTVPRFKMLAEMQSMQQALAMSRMMLGLSYQHANAMSDWVSPSGYEYGDSSTGYHSSQYGVDSAKAWDEGQAELARASGPLAEASYLKVVWQAVE